jgi:hypothetical protein
MTAISTTRSRVDIAIVFAAIRTMTRTRMAPSGVRRVRVFLRDRFFRTSGGNRIHHATLGKREGRLP